MSNRQIIDSSTSEFWEKAYQSADMAWDLGEPTPVFNQWINSERNTLSICVLGAGNGWDALNFAKKGHHVTAVDFAFSAIQNMSQMAEILGVELDLLHSNIFDIGKSYHNAFDIVLEYTCYCAIDPRRRIDYVNLVDCILKPEGRLVALFFPLDKALNDDGPPFGVNLNSTLNLFSKKFTLYKKETPHLSIERRIGREMFVIFNKNGN